MAKNEDPERFSFAGGSVPAAAAAAAAAARPTITLPPRQSMDAFFSVSGTGASPGPLTLVSRFFSESTPDSDQRSFTQLLAGAIASPLARPPPPLGFGLENHGGENSSAAPKGDKDSLASGGFKQGRPLNLVVANPPSLFMMSPGLSPSGLLNSPNFFSPPSPFGMSHQQALAQVTAQAAFAQSLQVEYPASSEAQQSRTLDPFVKNEPFQHQQAVPSTSDPRSSAVESLGGSHLDRRYQPPSHTTDKPADDGYNWRKYGQKQVKGSEFPRSYYKCTHLKCPVKKKVERSPDGQITEIIYKGQHNHEMPQPGKRAKDSGDPNGNANFHVKSENKVGTLHMSNGTALSRPVLERDQDSAQGAPGQVPGSSDSEELVDGEVREDDADADEPNAKRSRNTEVGPSDASLSHKTVTEPKIIVQTRSEVDLLDDGYRWRKYGQKVVKGNPHPRSYYKCTNAGCNVRKHVERASADPKAVITTYEGKHNHDVPAARNSSHNTANNHAHS